MRLASYRFFFREYRRLFSFALRNNLVRFLDFHSSAAPLIYGVIIRLFSKNLVWIANCYSYLVFDLYIYLESGIYCNGWGDKIIRILTRYGRITNTEREEISRSLATSKSITEIAKELGRHPATIFREIKRNSGKSGYRAFSTSNRA